MQNGNRFRNSISRPRLTWKLFVVVAWVGIFIGCGKAEKKEVYSVNGTVFINGKPAEDAWVMLKPDSEGLPTSMGRVEKDGTYQLTVYDQDLASYQKPGNPAGDYHVFVLMPKDPTKPLFQDRLGGVYADPKSFDHAVTIDLGENSLDPIEIENAKFIN